jgi:hypothetical protein
MQISIKTCERRAGLVIDRHPKSVNLVICWAPSLERFSVTRLVLQIIVTPRKKNPAWSRRQVDPQFNCAPRVYCVRFTLTAKIYCLCFVVLAEKLVFSPP